MKFAFIDAERAAWPVRPMCRVLRVSPAGYYAWRSRPESTHAREDRRLGVLVKEAHARSRAIYGSPRVHKKMRGAGEVVGRKRVVRLMREHGLRGRVRRKFVHTTVRDEAQPVAANVLARDFTASRPNERWVSDATYLRTPAGFLYLAVVLDLYSRFIVGWALGAFNDRHLALRALDMAVRRRAPRAGLLHHSDRGSTYTSEDYQDELTRLGVTCSMSRAGNCIDNAAMESWNGTLKTELGESFESLRHARNALFDYIEVFYNNERLHSTLGYMSPRDFERVHAHVAPIGQLSGNEDDSQPVAAVAVGALQITEVSDPSRVSDSDPLCL